MRIWIFSFLSVLFSTIPSIAQSFDLAPSHDSASDQSMQLSADHHYLSVTSKFKNVGSDNIDQPFNVGWYLSPMPRTGCSQLNPSITQTDPFYFMGFDFIAGVEVQQEKTGKLSHMDLQALKNSSGPISNGWHCLWTYANYNSRFPESNPNNNAYTFPTPICVGGHCESAFIRVYPVPAETELTIELSAPPKGGSTTLSIIALSGKKWMDQNDPFAPGQTSLPLNVQNLPAGEYILSVKNTDGSWTTPFIKR